MSDLVNRAIQAVHEGQQAFCKFLSANDTGDTGSHQAGIYIAKHAWPILFDQPGIKGQNKDAYVTIKWQNGLTTNSRFIYYGVGTRNEYRITRFGNDFPYLQPENTGDLFILVKESNEYYQGFVLSKEEDIELFLGAFAMGPANTGSIIEHGGTFPDTELGRALRDIARTFSGDFPSSVEMATMARQAYQSIFGSKSETPDRRLIAWIDVEYRLFKEFELRNYGKIISDGFDSVEDFIAVANSILNRRKSRAGKSLEHHLAAIFDEHNIAYESQPRTEGNKRPDFIFPSGAAYHDATYPSSCLVFLGAKTTCKDRWRQVINEADRIQRKHLFTLQQGISSQQLDEMAAEGITLVVPSPYIASFPTHKQSEIWSLKKFIAYVKESIPHR